MFITIPNDFASLYEDVIFAFSDSSEGDYASDKVVDILNSESGEILAVKKFYSADSYQINATPVVKPLTYPDIAAEPTGFVSDTTLNLGCMWVHISDEDGNESDSVLLTQSKHGQPERGVVSSIGEELQRVISLGERELVKIYVDPSESITIKERQYATGMAEAVAEVSYEGAANSTGFATFSIVAEYLPEQLEVIREFDLERFEIEVYGGDEALLSTLSYIVIDPPYEPVRIAWVSSHASIEHYTLPNVESRYRTSDGMQRLKLRTAPECDAIREVISEVVETSNLWVVGCDGDYIEAKVVSESVDLTPRAALTSIQFEIEYKYE